MFRPVLKVLGVCFFLGGCGVAQNPEAGQRASSSAFAAEPAADMVSDLRESAAADRELRAEDSDSLRFLLVQFSPRMPFQVDSIEPDGSIRIRVQFSDRWAENFARSGIPPRVGAAMMSQLTEGYFLGLSGLPESNGMMVLEDIRQGRAAIDNVHALRVQVLQVQEDGQAVCRVGPAAAGHLKKGDSFVLIRPAGSTTSQLQATPDLISVVDGSTEATGMDSRNAARRVPFTNNLKQIGIAMHNFHDTYRCFPPAVIYGPDGKPWHSWRVLLLPFLEQKALYDQYRFDEPWDGPNNKRLLEKVPSVYRDPIYAEIGDSYTHYAVAVGEGTGFSPDGYTLPANVTAKSWRGTDRSSVGRRIAEFRDGTANTLLVGSISPERKIPWMKPEDVVFDQQFPGLGKDQGFAAPYQTEKGSGGVFVFADGSVHTIRDDIDIAVLRNLVQIDDGQPIGEFPRLQPAPRPRHQSVLVLTIPRDKPGTPAKLTIEDLRSERVQIPADPGMPAVPAASEAARKVQSSNNLKQLGVAIHNYHDVHKVFPPYTTGSTAGKQLLSWRVHILPWLDQIALYDQFRKDEPWDSEHNKTLIAKMPAVFRSPNSKAEPGKTNYLGVSGPQGIFPGRESISFRDVTDGTANTIMVVEASDTSALIWTMPDDFVPDAKDPKKGLGGLWSDGFHGLFADGSVRFLTGATDDESLQALFTRGGSEVINRDRVGQFRTVPRPSVQVLPRGEAQPALPVADQPREPVSRTWTDSTGKFQVQAILRGFRDGTVTLEKEDGDVIHLPIDRLSPPDQQYVRTHTDD